MKRWLAAVLAFALVAGACSGTEVGETTTATTPPQSTTTETEDSTTTTGGTTTTSTPTTERTTAGMQPRQVGAFSDFEVVPLLLDSPAYQGPATPSSIAGIYMPESFSRDLDPGAIDVLESQGFVVVPGNARLFHPLYETFHYEGEVYFVTTDAAYHYMHLGFSKILRDLEQYQLLPILEKLLGGLVDASRRQRDELAETNLAESADRVAQFYEAAATLLELDIGPIGDLAKQEVELAEEAAGLQASPITSLHGCDQMTMMGCADFSLFKPRGHYTRSAELERYFRAMSVLGNENFNVGDGDTMVLAALASRVLVSDPQLLDWWTLVYEPTAFLVGMADDYTPTELADQLDELIPGWRDDPTLIDPAVAKTAGAALVDLRPVSIDPASSSVRIMGARFVVDSYIYDQLRGPNVGDPPFGRRYATPLDLVATFGSDLVYEILGDEEVLFHPQTQDGTAEYLIDPSTGERWTNLDTQFEKLTNMISERDASDWAATVYDAWLYSLEPVWQRHGEAYPDFMQTRSWEIKDLQTGLGSYTELKHDTILYAKQSFAAQGGYEEVQYPDPRHWVEPNPVAFQRMAAVLDLLRDGLADRALLPAESDNAELIEALGNFIDRLGRLAADQLAGEPISSEDNEWLGSIGSLMEALRIRSSDEVEEATGDFPDQDLNSAVVADIMRTNFHILEIGTGYVDSLYVLVPTDEGRFQIAKGAVYSYYEFWRKSDAGRLTDQEWWELLDSNPPDRPNWQDPLFEPAPEDVGLQRGLTCHDLAGLTEPIGYEDVLAYWIGYGKPQELDRDDNGIPCDQEPEPLYEPTLFADLPDEADLFCRDLNALGHDFADAIAYWVREGSPDRMDADRNGFPCETVFPKEEIDAFFNVSQHR